MQTGSLPRLCRGRMRRWLVGAGIMLGVLATALSLLSYWIDSSIYRQANREDKEPVSPFHRPAPLGIDAEKSLALLSQTKRIDHPHLPQTLVPPVSEVDHQPVWATSYGREFWRNPSPPSALAQMKPSTGRTEQGAIDATKVIERVSCAFQNVPGQHGPQVITPSFQASLHGANLKFKPASPASFYQPGLNMRLPVDTAEAEIRSVRISRQQDLLYSAEPNSAGWSVLGNTAQRLLSRENVMVEHLEARHSGMTVTWVLMQSVKGSGPLTVETELTGLKYAGQTESGLHFADSSGTARVRLGNVTIVDFQGSRWEGAWQVENQALKIEVAASILEQAVYPLAIDPEISAEYGLDRPITTTPSFSEMALSVGVNSNKALVIWTRGKGEASDPSIRGVRVSPSGQILDPYGFEISSLAAEQAVTAVGVCGDEFLVVWSAPRGASVSDWDIYGARISAEGSLLDPAPMTICGLSSSLQTSPSVAANGNRYLVVWRDSRSTGIYGTLVGRDGAIQSTNGLPICAAANDQYQPAVAALGDTFLVVWQDFRRSSSTQYYGDIYGARVTSEGRLLDTNGIAIGTKANTQWQPSVAALGTNYLVVWEEYDLLGNDIHGARVTLDGQVLETNGMAISTARNLQASPRVTARSNDFLVVWQDYRNSTSNNIQSDIYGARVDPNGLVLDSEGIPLTEAAHNQCLPAVSSGPGGDMVVWQDDRNSPAVLCFTPQGGWIRETNGEAVLNERVLSASPNAEVAPTVAPLGTNYLVVWADNRNIADSGWDIYGVRVDGHGQIRDVAGIPISTAKKNQLSPAVAANSNSVLVVWTDYRNSPAFTNLGDIFGTQIGLDGSVASPSGFAFSTAPQNQNFPAIASDGSRFMVVWQDARNSLTNALRWDIYGALFDPNVRCLDQRCLPEEVPICVESGNQQQPALAASATQYLVVWADYRNGATSDIYGARVETSGIILETNGIAICKAKGNQIAPAAAASGDQYLVVWTDFRNGSASDIYGARLLIDGSLHDPEGFPIRTVPNHQSNPQIAVNGHDYLVTWQEARSGVSNNYDVFAITIQRNGQVSEEDELAINTNAGHQANPVLVGDGAGGFLIFLQDSQFGIPRVAGNLLRPSQPSPVPSRLHSAQRLADGAFEFLISGEAGSTYAIETSNLRHPWTCIATLVSSNGVLRFRDQAATNSNPCFYRVITLP